MTKTILEELIESYSGAFHEKTAIELYVLAVVPEKIHVARTYIALDTYDKKTEMTTCKLDACEIKDNMFSVGDKHDSYLKLGQHGCPWLLDIRLCKDEVLSLLAKFNAGEPIVIDSFRSDTYISIAVAGSDLEKCREFAEKHSKVMAAAYALEKCRALAEKTYVLAYR